jgi:DUF1707 SHOCT-like domain/2TM domain
MAPLAPTNVTLRVGDRDREAAANRLGQALAQGYLDMTEYERRVEAAFAAHTAAELGDLLADLPVHRMRQDDPARRAARDAAARMSVRLHLAGYLLMVVIVLAVWLSVALSGGSWYFWPVWPILGAGIGVLGHAIPIRWTTHGRGSAHRVGGAAHQGCASLKTAPVNCP